MNPLQFLLALVLEAGAAALLWMGERDVVRLGPVRLERDVRAIADAGGAPATGAAH